METTANGTSPFHCGFGCTAPEGQDGTGLRLRSHGTTAQALIAGLMEREGSWYRTVRRVRVTTRVHVRSVTREDERGAQICGKLG
jgi:hypothetical protein